MDHLGKLKRTIQKNCPDCGRKTLQIRIVEEEIKCKGEDEETPEIKELITPEEKEDAVRTKEIEYLYCPFCEYEERYTDKKVRKHVNQREEEEVLWQASPPIKSYGKSSKKKSERQSNVRHKGY